MRVLVVLISLIVSGLAQSPVTCDSTETSNYVQALCGSGTLTCGPDLCQCNGTQPYLFACITSTVTKQPLMSADGTFPLYWSAWVSSTTTSCSYDAVMVDKAGRKSVQHFTGGHWTWLRVPMLRTSFPINYFIENMSNDCDPNVTLLTQIDLLG